MIREILVRFRTNDFREKKNFSTKRTYLYFDYLSIDILCFLLIFKLIYCDLIFILLGNMSSFDFRSDK